MLQHFKTPFTTVEIVYLHNIMLLVVEDLQ